MAKKTKLPYPHSNLGKYLHAKKYKAKLDSEPKQTVNKRGKSSPTVKKMTRRIAKEMSTSKGYFNG
jgi:hypothetical protein